MQQSTELKTGWSMKHCDDQSDATWFPVKQVPSEVHIDLLANKQYASYRLQATQRLINS